MFFHKPKKSMSIFARVKYRIKIKNCKTLDMNCQETNVTDG